MASRGDEIVASDIEKGAALKPIDDGLESSTERPSSERDAAFDVDEILPSDSKIIKLAKRIERYLRLEARGIHRVQSKEQSPKTTLTFMQMVMMWFSINTAAQNITLASIGQSVYGLGFVDATLLSIFGAIIGVSPAAYAAGWGPWTGNRTMVCSSHLDHGRKGTGANTLLDLCTVFHGMVASETLCPPQPCYRHWVCHD